MRFEASDSHHNRLAGCSIRHVLVPRDELEYVMCQVYAVDEGESRGNLLEGTVALLTNIHTQCMFTVRSKIGA